MSDALEQQAEEIEALASIYEGDSFFKQINSTTFQYKYGEEDNEKSFIVEISWTPEYPNEMPKISMDTFFNRSISHTFKSKIVDILTKEGENWIGCAMTYTLFECLKEQLTELLIELEEEQKAAKIAAVTDYVKTIQLAPAVIKTADAQGVPVKKEQMTKSQKRRNWERLDNKGQKPRGWNWVDIIRHLSQTGYKDEPTITTSTTVTSQPLAPPPNNY